MLCQQTENCNNTISELNKLEIAKTDCSTVTDALHVEAYLVLTHNLRSRGTIKRRQTEVK